MEDKENIPVLCNEIGFSDSMNYVKDSNQRNSLSFSIPNNKKLDNTSPLYHSILLNKIDNSESEYYSCNESFNTTIYDENSLSLSLIVKDNKEERKLITESQLSGGLPISDVKNDMHSLNHDIKFNQKKYSKNTTKIDTNPQSHPSGSHGLDHVNISTELNDPEIEDELEFYKKRADSLFVKHSLHPYVKAFNNIPLEQKYEISLLAWKNNQKSLALEILESIIYDSGNHLRNSSQKDELIIRQANKFLGFCYLTGDGIKKNVEKSVMYFKKSDTTDSLFLLGIIYFTGYIEKEDAAADSLHLAEKWFKMAAERGHLSSQIMLLYLMYMEEERSINNYQERTNLIDENKIKELSFMFNEESLQKITEYVRRINQNILHDTMMIHPSDRSSNVLINKNSLSSLNSATNSSCNQGFPFKTNQSHKTPSLSSTLNTFPSVFSYSHGAEIKSNYSSQLQTQTQQSSQPLFQQQQPQSQHSHFNNFNNNLYNYSFTSSNTKYSIPTSSVNKNEFFNKNLNHKLSVDTLNYYIPTNINNNNNNNNIGSVVSNYKSLSAFNENYYRSSASSTSNKFLYGSYKTPQEIASINRHKNILYWLEKAAQHQNVPPFIFFELGYYYQNGIGTEKNFKEAAHWYQCLVDHEEDYLKQYPWINNNILYAKYQLARLAPSVHKSLDWLIHAANNGNAMAQTCLGQYYFEQNSIQNKMQKYIVRHGSDFDLPGFFGKKNKSFEILALKDNLQHSKGFQCFFNELVGKLYEQEQQDKRDFNRQLIPEVDFLNKIDIKRDKDYSYYQLSNNPYSNSNSNSSTLNATTTTSANNKSLFSSYSKHDDTLSPHSNYPSIPQTYSDRFSPAKKTIKLFRRLTLKKSSNNRRSLEKEDYESNTISHYEPSYLGSSVPSTLSSMTTPMTKPKTTVMASTLTSASKSTFSSNSLETTRLFDRKAHKKNKKIKSFRELKKSFYNRIRSSKNKKSSLGNNHSYNSSEGMNSSNKIILEKSALQDCPSNLNKETFSPFTNSYHESKHFHYFDKLEEEEEELNHSIVLQAPSSVNEELILSNDIIMSNLSLLHEWNLLDAYRSALQKEIASFIQVNGKFIDNKSKKYENKVNFNGSYQSLKKNVTDKEEEKEGQDEKEEEVEKIEVNHFTSSSLSSSSPYSSEPQSFQADDVISNHKIPKDLSINTVAAITPSEAIPLSETSKVFPSILNKSLNENSDTFLSTPQDDKLEMGQYWLTSAANGTNNYDGPYFVAQFILGLNYEKGKQLSKDESLSIYWLKRALEKFIDENVNSIMIHEAFCKDIAIAKEEVEMQSDIQDHYHYHHRYQQYSSNCNVSNSNTNGNSNGNVKGFDNGYGNDNKNGKGNGHGLNCVKCSLINESIPEDDDDQNEENEGHIIAMTIPSLSRAFKKKNIPLPFTKKKKSIFSSKKEINSINDKNSGYKTYNVIKIT
ncbi:HCP-like protein [Neocallimastix lanati (nom. inval.)]|nr:HCP-like protein [Neocallimastix sp. JGI-2020a]